MFLPIYLEHHNQWGNKKALYTLILHTKLLLWNFDEKLLILNYFCLYITKLVLYINGWSYYAFLLAYTESWGLFGPNRGYNLGRLYILYVFIPFLIPLSGLCLEITILCHFSQGFLKCIICSGDKICKPLEPWERLIYLA